MSAIQRGKRPHILPVMGGRRRLHTNPADRGQHMGDEKKNEDLDDMSGGPDTVAPIITDALAWLAAIKG